MRPEDNGKSRSKQPLGILGTNRAASERRRPPETADAHGAVIRAEGPYVWPNLLDAAMDVFIFCFFYSRLNPFLCLPPLYRQECKQRGKP